jgi:hypothetical protein
MHKGENKMKEKEPYETRVLTSIFMHKIENWMKREC